MTFLSFNYLLLLSLTFITYYAVNNNYKYWIIFFASIIFILSISINALLFSLLITVLNYFGGLILYKRKKDKKVVKKIFWSLICADVGILVLFKYINFIFENINFLFSVFQTTSRIELSNFIIPVGISYYIFQTIGYLVRIIRGFELPERNFIKFSSFLLFFPKFLSGPVERSNHFLPQINNLRSFNQAKVSAGLRLILFGVFKKMVIADNLQSPVDLVYSNIHEYSGLPLISVFFIQLIYIYCNFSGYTDIALGSAKLLGIDIIDNFNRPFLAKSITEFWKRWHISLSSWCNEFIYLPFIIKYRRFGNTVSVLGIFITFVIIGIWHGANWTFVVLGLLQALAISYEFFTKRNRLKLATFAPAWLVNTISRILVYIFMSFSMIFFFSNSISDSGYFISHVFENIELKFPLNFSSLNKLNFTFGLFSFFILLGIELVNEIGYNLEPFFLKQSRWIRWSTYYFIIILIFLFNSEVSGFVYERF